MSAFKMPARCHSCRKEFDLGHVTVVGRYADCDMWKCPGCGATHDSRMAWTGPEWRRMGYDDLAIAERAVRERALQPRWRSL